MFLALIKILTKYQTKMFYKLKLMQRVNNIVIRDNPHDLAKIFDKGIYLSVNKRQLFITHLLIR